jgi:hypothetical protein
LNRIEFSGAFAICKLCTVSAVGGCALRHGRQQATEATKKTSREDREPQTSRRLHRPTEHIYRQLKLKIWKIWFSEDENGRTVRQKKRRNHHQVLTVVLLSQA